MTESLRSKFEVSIADGVGTITFNEPEKLNPFTHPLLRTLGELLRELDNEPSVRVLVITGKGRYFSAGTDFRARYGSNREEVSKVVYDGLGFFTDTLIELKAPLVALVNGPAVGIGVTLLAHCDLVIASSEARFNTPFMKLAICAEAASSILFPRMMGAVRSNALLLQGRTITAHEALDWGLVSEVIEASQFEKLAPGKAVEMAKFPKQALIDTKALLKTKEIKQSLHEANYREIVVLVERYH